MSMLTSVKFYHIIVLIYTSLIFSDLEFLFLCLFALCISSVEKCVFRTSAYFSVGLFAFCCL